MADFAYHTAPAPMANERWLSSRRCEQNLETIQRERSAWQLTAYQAPFTIMRFTAADSRREAPRLSRRGKMAAERVPFPSGQRE
jgi:hypothetical protein